MSVQDGGRLLFGDFELNVRAGKLLCEGRAIKIQPQPLRVLAILAERRGEIVSRDYLRDRIWGNATFVEFDQGLNFCIRQIRLALRDDAANPTYVETLPKQGYRFIAPVTVSGSSGVDASPNLRGDENEVTASAPLVPRNGADFDPAAATPLADRVPSAKNRWGWYVAAACFAVAVARPVLFPKMSVIPGAPKFTQLTDFTDSAAGPALSPDGRMVAFLRGEAFLTADQVYVKLLPNGEPRRLTDDPRLKYGVSFSPDSSQVAYTVLEYPDWKTYTVPVLGGDPQLLLPNAAAVSWLDPTHILFSRTREGQHMGIVSGNASGQELREIYLPVHERAMAHQALPSPDRNSALVIEMNELGGWAPCRLISIANPSPAKTIGPKGPCLGAGWSSDGEWMYFSAVMNGQSHIWRQKATGGEPEQLTFGPTEEEGLSVAPDGHSLVTAVGTRNSAIWIHDSSTERSLSFEGEIVSVFSPPIFSADEKTLYYLLRRQTQSPGPELWQMSIETGKSQAILPGVAMEAFDVSSDGKEIVYAANTSTGTPQLWIAPTDRSSAPKLIGEGTTPHFGTRERILFERVEGQFNYLEQMNRDGSARSRVVPFPISELTGVSPARRWVMVMAPLGQNGGPAPLAVPVEGGNSRRICRDFCRPSWSSNGKYLIVPVEFASSKGQGRSLALPIGLDESIPSLPAEGIPPGALASIVAKAVSIPRSSLVMGRDPAHYVYVNTTVHRNLYRVSLP